MRRTVSTIEFPSRTGVWWTSDSRPIAEVRRSAAELEELGYGSLWFGEAYGKEAFTQSAALLAATARLVVGTGIANIHARDAVAAESGGRTLSALHAGRFALGLGVSHAPLVARRAGHYDKPLATMRDYLQRMDEVPDGVEPDAPRPYRLLAALGPRMLELARTATRGAFPYLVTPQHTAMAREAVGPDRTLVVEQAAVLTGDRETARSRAHRHLEIYSGLPNYRNNWKRLGFTDEDMPRGGSDRLKDALVVWGDEDAISARVSEHLDAGADHVCVQLIGEDLTADPLPDLRRLAPALVAL